MFYNISADFLARLPERLQAVTEFSALAGAVNPELDAGNAAIAGMVANTAISTADAPGLSRWEAILGVSTPLTVYRSRIVSDPYYFEVLSEKDRVADGVIEGNAVQNGTPTPEAPITPVCLPAGTEIKIVGENVISYPYTDTTKTGGGVTCTDNQDGSITFNGASVSSIAFNFKSVDSLFKIPAGNYKLSGFKFSGSGSTYYLTINKYLDGVSQGSIAADYGNGVGFSVSEADSTACNYRVVFYILPGVTVSNLVIKPIIYDTTINPTTLTVPCDLWAMPDGLFKDSWNPLTGNASADCGIYTVTGAENWVMVSAGIYRLAVGSGMPPYKASSIWCNNYGGVSPASTDAESATKGNLTAFLRKHNGFDRLYIRDDTYTDTAGFKVHLAALYAAGTPVKIWFAKATTTTVQYPPQPITLPKGIVNVVVEPPEGQGVLPSKIHLVIAEYLAKETLNARRNALKAHLMTKPPINLETLRHIIETYMGVAVEIGLSASVVSVLYRGTAKVADIRPLYATLYETIPASLLVEIAYKYLIWQELDAQALTFSALDAKHFNWNTLERGEWIG